MIPVTVGTPCRLRRAGLALVVGIALHGCAARPPAATSSSGSTADQAQAELPSGAIRVGDQLYKVAISADDDGCRKCQLYSPTRLVPQAIYYRDPAGGSTSDRQQADCASDTPD